MKPDDISGQGLAATDCERQIIASMRDGSSEHLPAMLNILPDPGAFLDEDCRLIWAAVKQLHASGEPVMHDSIKAVLLADVGNEDIGNALLPLFDSHSLINRKQAEWHARQVAHAHARRVSAESLRLIEGSTTKPEELLVELREKMRTLESITINTGESLPEPVPLALKMPPVREFDPAWLPSSLRPWIADIAERMQCPPDFPAVAAMVTLSSVAARRFCIQPKLQDEGFCEFPHVWGMLIGRPSLMKSPSMQAAMRPLKAMQKSANQTWSDAERDRQADGIAAKFKRLAKEQEAKRAAKNGGDFDYSCLIEGEDESAPRRRFLVNDASLEALGEVLRENPLGVMLYQDELAGLLAMLEREGNQALRAFLLTAWSGKDGFTFDRIGRGTRVIETCAVSILGSIQPGVIASHVRAAQTESAGADGFLQRFSLMVWPDLKEDWKDIDRPIDGQAEDEATSVFEAMERLRHEDLLKAGVAPNRDGIPTFKFAPDAQERFRAWRASLESRLRTEGLAPAIEAHLAKYRKLVPALAVLIHVADWETGPVSLSALDRALSWAAYLETHAARVYGTGSVADTQGAMTLLKKLQENPSALPHPFTARDVYRKGWSGLARTDTAEAACELLTGHDWLLASVHGSTQRGGRPTFLYRLNPRALK